MGLNDRHFENLRKSIFDELLQASLHFKIFWELSTASKEIADVRNVYLSFFVLTIRSHHNLFCVRIHNVTKDDHRTGNLPRLLNYIKSNAVLLEVYPLKQIESMFNILSEHEKLISKIQKMRNQYIAHNQLQKEDLTIPLKYTHDEGEKLLTDLQKMLNRLSSLYDGNAFYFDVIPKPNIEQMLTDLTEFRQFKLDKYKGL